MIKQLACIKEGILAVRRNEYRDFFWVCFSVCVRKVSLADPRVSVPVRLRPERYPPDHQLRNKMRSRLHWLRRANVLQVFDRTVRQNLQRMAALEESVEQKSECRIFPDARDLKAEPPDEGRCVRVRAGSVQLIITSPPYPGAQKYVRTASLSMGWLGLCESRELRDIKGLAIGREEFRQAEVRERIHGGVRAADTVLRSIQSRNPTRAHIAACYLMEMHEALSEIVRVLKAGGYLVLVAANSRICGRDFRTASYLRTIAEALGLKIRLSLLDDIRSRGLMTKRNKTANVISRECVMVFQKGT